MTWKKRAMAVRVQRKISFVRALLCLKATIILMYRLHRAGTKKLSSRQWFGLVA
jgi:hypothetical protein